VGVKAAAVSVNSATTVFAAEVRIAFTSGVGSIGVAGAQAAMSRAIANRVIGSFEFMVPLLGSMGDLVITHKSVSVISRSQSQSILPRISLIHADF
jgi:hypothetical protein